MRYLASILRIFVLVAVVLSIANFSDVQKVKAAAVLTFPDANSCAISGSNTSATPYAFPVATCEGKDVTITGPGAGSNLFIEMSGTHTFKNLTITNHATVTQEAIVPADINVNRITLMGTGLSKKVDLKVDGILTLTNQGRIDVSGKGFPGGVSNLVDRTNIKGYGPGGGCSKDGKIYSGGGYGGFASSNECSDGGVAYGDLQAPIENGSGGGASLLFGDRPGSPGGGVIKIDANQMVMENNDQTFIATNGDSSDLAGGGAGGSIWIKATVSPSSGPPSTKGNKVDKNPYTYFGSDGTVVGSSDQFGQFVTANGGANGGAGGRIRLEVNNPIVQNCYITKLNEIPVFCERKDVVIDGADINNAKAVNADAVIIDGSSTRHFTNLTIKNNGVLTHTSILTSDINNVPAENSNYLKDSGKIKKVDLVISGNLILESGGKIDVSAKGFPGGVWGSSHNDGYGPGGSVAGGVTTSQPPSGGAGNGGKGGTGDDVGGAVKGGSPYETIWGDKVFDSNNLNRFLPGSGSGADHNLGDNTTVSGASGGGWIHLEIQGNMKVDISSKILANGGNGNAEHDVDHNNSTRRSGSGGGAGGTIWLEINSTTSSTGAEPELVSGNTANPPCNIPGRCVRGSDGFVSSTSLLPLNIIADGGNGQWGNDGTHAYNGGGGIVWGASITPLPSIQSKKIEVTVTWQEGTLPKKSVKLYSVLRSVVP